MQIHGTNHVHGSHGINAPHFAQRGPGLHSPAAGPATDCVEISPAAEAAIQAVESKGVRQDLVNSIRAQINAGTYDTPEKFDAALERLLDTLG
jgi:negative regulator of flagellin synthesis FlgM